MHTSTRAASFVLVLLAAACGGSSSPATVASPSPTTATTATASTGATTTVGTTSCATGDGVNDACACDTDAHTYCSGFYGDDWQSYAEAHGYTTASWKYGLIDCLGKNPVSSACQASLDRRETLNEQMMAACATYCRGTTPQPGEEPCVDHLKSVYDTLDPSCRSALDAHEAAKALQGDGPLDVGDNRQACATSDFAAMLQLGS